MDKNELSESILKRIKCNANLNIKTHIIKSVEEYISISGKLMNDGFWVSRGHSKLEWKLQPSIMRKKLLETINYVDFGYDYESIITTEFMDKYSYYLDLKIDSQDFTSHLMAMQHYELPTRLLDWTLNPQTALFFAINYKPESQDESLVWFANPALFNNISLKQQRRLYLRRETDDVNQRSHLALYKNREQLGNESNLFPVFFKPKYMFDRIVVQESVFSIAGFTSLPIEEIPEFSECLSCVILDNKNNRIYNDVNNNLKLYYEKYFPDISGFVEGLKRT